MTGSTIATSIDHSVTLGARGYVSPLKITSAGTIDGSADAGSALYIPPESALIEIENAGLVRGAIGRVVGKIGHDGADGVYAATAGKISNTGTIAGGDGGTAPPNVKGVSSSGDGGIGVDITTSGVSLTNKGTIYGGAGGYLGKHVTPSQVNGAGGDGVDIGVGAALHNTGRITGGAGGGATAGLSYVIGGYGGIGVSDINGSLINGGTIQGGAGGDGVAGVDIQGAKASGRNTGWIIGGNSTANSGAGGYGAFSGVGLVASESAVFTNSGTIAAGTGQLGAQISGASLINSGLIQAGYDLGTPQKRGGAYGVEFYGGKLINSGTILGGSAPHTATTFAVGVSGGDGVYAEQGFTNRGQILGGAAGNGGIGGVGGDGVRAVGPHIPLGAVSNSGIIIGGEGGIGNGEAPNPSAGGAGGVGVYIADGSLSNTGTVIGGIGGSDAYRSGGAGGAGAVVELGVLINRGIIMGGNGGSGMQGGNGGDGVYLANATLVNAGTILGGVAGAGPNGLSGDAVHLGANATLVVESGAGFQGLVAADLTGSDTLELSGKSPNALTGIGTSFAGFTTIDFAANAAWTIAGTTDGLAAGEDITGFTGSDAIMLTDAAAANGSVTVANAGTVTIDAGGTRIALDISGAKKGETDFSFADDTLTKTAGAAMSFLAAPAQQAGATVNPGLLFSPSVLEAGFLPYAEANPGFTLATAASFGFTQDLLQSAQKAILPAVTLHS